MIPLNEEIQVTSLVSAFRYTFSKNFKYDGEKHDGWEFVYVDSGKIAIQADDKKYILKAGELVCHKPMEFHTLSPYHSDATATIFCFHCSGEKMRFFENKILSIDQHQRLYLNDIVTHANAFLIPKLPLDINRDGYMQKKPSGSCIDAHFIKNSIELVILSLYSSQSTEIQSRADSYSQHLKRKHLVEEIKAYLTANIGKPINLADIAAEFSYSVSTIKTAFKDETGCSVFEYYNQQRLNIAKNLLRMNRYSIGEIADLLGFNNTSHFSNFFKNATGCSPRKFLRIDSLNMPYTSNKF